MNENQKRVSDIADEIDLVPLFHELWNGRLPILIAMLVFTVLSATYIFLRQPLYQADAFIQSPLQSDIESLNQGRGAGTGLDLISTNDVYGIYLRNLQSASLQQKFYREVFLPETQRNGASKVDPELSNNFDRLLSIGLVDRNVPTRYVLSMRASQPSTARDWAAKYVEMAAEVAKRETLNSVMSDVSAKVDELQRQIQGARESAKQQRIDKIARLEESMRVAQSIGLTKPSLPSGPIQQPSSTDLSGDLTYLRGSEALEAEIENVKGRPSDDPYIPDLRKIQTNLAFYQNLKYRPEDIQVYRRDGSVLLPNAPLGRRALLTVVAGAFVGFVIGVSWVFGRKYWREISFRGESLT
jgi:chain length determinant protein (polysaccharide antigen chain regulator)